MADEEACPHACAACPYRENRVDCELQPYLARKALAGLDTLLTAARPHEVIALGEMGALLRLVQQAAI